MSKAQVQTSEIIFWLFDWDVTDISPMTRRRHNPCLCVIDTQKIVLKVSQSHIEIDLAQIETCEKVRISIAPIVYNVRLECKSDTIIQKGKSSGNKLFFLPEQLRDIDNLVNVINAFRNGESIDVHPNPYYRELARDGKLAEFSDSRWNPLTPPNIYFPPPTIKASLYNIFIFLAIVVIGTALITGAIVLLDYFFDI